MTTQELETVKKELAGISTFVKERVKPAADEQARLTEAINGLADTGKELRRRGLTSQADDEDRRVDSGPYAGVRRARSRDWAKPAARRPGAGRGSGRRGLDGPSAGRHGQSDGRRRRRADSHGAGVAALAGTYTSKP